MHCRKLPRNIRGEVTSYYANIWVASAGVLEPAKLCTDESCQVLHCASEWATAACACSHRLVCSTGLHTFVVELIPAVHVFGVPIITETT